MSYVYVWATKLSSHHSQATLSVSNKNLPREEVGVDEWASKTSDLITLLCDGQLLNRFIFQQWFVTLLEGTEKWSDQKTLVFPEGMNRKHILFNFGDFLTRTGASFLPTLDAIFFVNKISQSWLQSSDWSVLSQWKQLLMGTTPNCWWWFRTQEPDNKYLMRKYQKSSNVLQRYTKNILYLYLGPELHKQLLTFCYAMLQNLLYVLLFLTNRQTHRTLV